MTLPTENQYIDLHTHLPWNYPHIFSIRNYVDKPKIEASLQKNTAISAGLHPWKLIPGKDEEFLALVKAASSMPQVLAIGECGIDLKIETSYDLQEAVFLKQAALAEEVKKPLIIHCVRAYHQMLQPMMKHKPTVPWIFHGFNNNQQVAGEFIKQGAYLSVGHDLMKDNSKIRAAFYQLPITNIFFETDEWQQPVWKLYAEAAKILRIPEKDLKKQVYNNFRTCFTEISSGS